MTRELLYYTKLCHTIYRPNTTYTLEIKDCDYIHVNVYIQIYFILK